MNDIFKDKLAQLNDDKLMLKAIKELFFLRVEKEKPGVDKMDNNALLGEKYRAYEKARELMEQTFGDLLLYQRSKKAEKTFAKER